MEIIDFHTHIYPRQIAERASRNICDFYGLEKYQIGTAESLLEKGRAAGVTRFVMLQVAIKPEQVRHINDFALEVIRAYPGVFYAFGALHPEMDDPFAEMDRLRVLGFKGIKLHPDMQRINIDDPRMYPLYEDLQASGFPVLFHCGDKTRDYSNPRRLHKVLELFPRLRCIAAPLGGWSVFDEAYACLKDTDCMVDSCSCSKFMSREEMARHIRDYGAERVLFGTDFPIWEHSEEVRMIESLPLTDDEKEKIFCANALGLLR